MAKYTICFVMLCISLILLEVFTTIDSEPEQEEKAKVYFGIKDTNTGIGIPDVVAEIYRETISNQWNLLATGLTTVRGGVNFNLTTTQFDAGIYRVVFHTRPYFEGRNMSSFYPYVESIFEKIESGNIEYTLPFYVSPFGYGSYRGWTNPAV